MAGTRRVVIVGIPGVGKTTVVEHMVRVLESRDTGVRVVSFGTEMLEQAKKRGIRDRDALRKEGRDEQERLQREAAKSISVIDSEVVIIDTHAFIATPSGYYPGLPSPILDIIRPTHLISLTAKPERILSRRERDKSRMRDRNSISGIKRELAIQDAMLSACSVHSGSPIMPVYNRDGEASEAAEAILKSVGL